MPPLTRAPLAISGLVSAAALPAPRAQAQDRCLLYEPEVVVLRGTIVRFKAYGKPGYGDDSKHDTIKRYDALKLDAPLCILQQGKDEIDTNKADIRVVQLVFSKPPYSTPAGIHVAVSGTLFHEHTGHHHTTVLLTVRQIRF